MSVLQFPHPLDSFFSQILWAPPSAVIAKTMAEPQPPALRGTLPTASQSRHERMDVEDRGLLERVAAARDLVAFEQLYARFRPRFAAFLARLIRDPATVEEVYNDVMLLVWNKAASYQGGARVSTWIFAIGYRRALKALAVSRRHASSPPLLAAEAPDAIEQEHADALSVQQSQAAMETLIEQAEQRNRLEVALRALSDEQRMVVELSYFSDYNYEEIAGIVNCPVNTVKTRMFYARRRLRDLLVSFEGSPSPAAAQTP